jgi:rhodanese-related sulfurtransferase
MSPRMTAVHRSLAAAAAVLAVSAAIVGTPAAPARVATVATGGGERGEAFVARTVDALQLAAWIREGARDLRVLDLRGRAAYETDHVPSAEAADFARLDTLAAPANATVVVYSDDDVRDAQASANLAARGHRQAYVLSGGMDAWTDEVMAPVLRGDSADYVAALSRYFGGAPRVTGARDRQPAPQRAGIARGHVSGSSTEPTAAASGELGETPRRGC